MDVESLPPSGRLRVPRGTEKLFAGIAIAKPFSSRLATNGTLFLPCAKSAAEVFKIKGAFFGPSCRAMGPVERIHECLANIWDRSLRDAQRRRHVLFIVLSPSHSARRTRKIKDGRGQGVRSVDCELIFQDGPRFGRGYRFGYRFTGRRVGNDGVGCESRGHKSRLLTIKL